MYDNIETPVCEVIIAVAVESDGSIHSAATKNWKKLSAKTKRDFITVIRGRCTRLERELNHDCVGFAPDQLRLFG